MAATAMSDPDFIYFREEAISKARCNYCQILMDVSGVEDHRERCEENPKNIDR